MLRCCEAVNKMHWKQQHFVIYFSLVIASQVSPIVFAADVQHSVSGGAGATTSSVQGAANPSSAIDSRVDRTQPLNKILGENEIVSSTLLFWNLTNGRKIDANLVKESGLNPKKVTTFLSTLKADEKLSASDRKTLREEYRGDNLGVKIEARKKFDRFVTRFQDRFPELQDTLPEILTVWGEARDLSGFRDEDDRIQQAKMASIVHVIRNRTIRQLKYRSKRTAKMKPHRVKWDVVMKRYQFSAFEPYDPNLAEIALGPVRKKRGEGLDTFPNLDRKALLNLSRAIAKLDRKEIVLPMPLAHENTRHYLTPNLVPLNDKSEKRMKRMIASTKRRRVLKLPHETPKFLAVAPSWAKQDSMIVEPGIQVKVDPSSDFMNTIIPFSDFVYFRGLK